MWLAQKLPKYINLRIAATGTSLIGGGGLFSFQISDMLGINLPWIFKNYRDWPIPIWRTRLPVLLSYDVYSSQCVDITTENALEALFGSTLLCLGWKFRQWLGFGYFANDRAVVVVPRKKRVQFGEAIPWKELKPIIDKELDEIRFDQPVVCSGRCPHALWMYLGQNLAASSVKIINFPFSGAKPQVFSVKAPESTSSPRAYHLLHRHDWQHGTPHGESQQTLVFVSPHAYEVSDHSLPKHEAWNIVTLTSAERLTLHSNDLIGMSKYIHSQLDTLSSTQNVGVATSGPDALAFSLGMVVNPQKFKSIRFYEYVGGSYQPLEE